MSCRYVARDRPRILPGRHLDDCPGECDGCQPCTEAHCRVCGVEHHEHACPGCMDETREALTEILRMCDALPEEAEARGVNSEAMNLLGPAADWEQANHVEASVLAGRLPADWIDHADHELHPLIVLGGWESVWREEFSHDDTAKQTIADAGRYLAEQLTRASTWPHVPFEDTARDLRRCCTHLEAVLHDGEQVDRGAPCLTCGTLLEKRWDVGKLGRDGWACPRCRDIHTADQYDFAMKHAYLAHAEWLTAEQMTQRTGVRRGTVIEWARRKHVRKRTAPITGLVEYAVADVLLRVSTVDEAG